MGAYSPAPFLTAPELTAVGRDYSARSPVKQNQSSPAKRSHAKTPSTPSSEFWAWRLCVSLS